LYSSRNKKCYICGEVRRLHKGDKQTYQSARFVMQNQFPAKLGILSPKICKQCLRAKHCHIVVNGFHFKARTRPKPVFTSRTRPDICFWDPDWTRKPNLPIESRCAQMRAIKKCSVRYSCRYTFFQSLALLLLRNTGYNVGSGKSHKMCMPLESRGSVFPLRTK